MSSDIQNLSTALESVAAGVAASLVSVLSHRMQASGFVWHAGLILTSDEGLAEEGEVQRGAARRREPARPDRRARCEHRHRPCSRSNGPICGPSPWPQLCPRPGRWCWRWAPRAVRPRRPLEWSTPQQGALAVDAWRRDRRTHRARCPLAVERPRARRAVNAAGQAFGMAVCGPRRRILVIPSVTIGRIAAGLETHRHVPRGYLGLGLQPVTLEGGGSGIMVMSVDPRGPGATANIHQGDVIVSWDGETIGKLQPLLRSLGPDSVGKLLAIELQTRRPIAPDKASDR